MNLPPLLSSFALIYIIHFFPDLFNTGIIIKHARLMLRKNNIAVFLYPLNGLCPLNHIELFHGSHFQIFIYITDITRQNNTSLIGLNTGNLTTNTVTSQKNQFYMRGNLLIPVFPIQEYQLITKIIQKLHNVFPFIIKGINGRSSKCHLFR